MITEWTKKNFYTLIVLFFVLQFATMWLGYDRLPQLSVVGDGPLIQDPALALARGQGQNTLPRCSEIGVN